MWFCLKTQQREEPEHEDPAAQEVPSDLLISAVAWSGEKSESEDVRERARPPKLAPRLEKAPIIQSSARDSIIVPAGFPRNPAISNQGHRQPGTELKKREIKFQT